MRKLLVALLALSLATAAYAGDGSIVPAQGKKVQDRYIVVLDDQAVDKSRVPDVANEMALAHAGRLHHLYQSALAGFAIELPEGRARALARDARVAYVEEDQEVHLVTTQSNATWGLDRIDQRNLPLSGTYTYDFDGTGVHAYIIDTGIRSTHTQFGGRATKDRDTVGDGQNGNDCNGHGTHVAGTVGGSTYGVAKNVRLHGVRVLNCQGSGTNSGVIAGVDWVAANRIQPAVANMSLGGGASSALDTAVNNAVNAGVFFAVAAGNENQNACNVSPARAANAYTVGSTTSSDARSSFSNFGSCVEIFAPGSSITSAWSTSDTATNIISGTSMATPHVAGAAALVLDENTGLTPSQVASTLTNRATTGVLTSIGTGSPNRLLFSLGSAPPPPPPPGGCPSGYTSYSGNLTGTGDNELEPNGTYYFSSVSGTHSGIMNGPSGTDFDLYLYKWNGSFWSNVAAAESSTSSETINYGGTSGYYLWEVYSFSGSGSYTFCLKKP
jgi:subtilisin family serine protease